MQISPQDLVEYIIYLLGILTIVAILLHHVYAQRKIAVRRRRK